MFDVSPFGTPSAQSLEPRFVMRIARPMRTTRRISFDGDASLRAIKIDCPWVQRHGGDYSTPFIPDLLNASVMVVRTYIYQEAGYRPACFMFPLLTFILFVVNYTDLSFIQRFAWGCHIRFTSILRSFIILSS